MAVKASENRQLGSQKATECNNLQLVEKRFTIVGDG